MNKNTTIGVLVVLVVIGLGYFILKSPTPVQVNTTIETPLQTDTTSPTTPTPESTPDAPVVTTGENTVASNATVSLNGTVKPNGLSTTYWFDYGESTAFGNRSTSQALGSGYSTIPTPGYITGLRSNTLYYYRLNAQNTVATVHGQMYSFETNSNPPPRVVAATVHTTTATAIARTDATINGEVNPNGIPTSYWFEYGTSTNFGGVTGYEQTNSGSTLVSVSSRITNLLPLTRYYFRLNVQNEFGTITGAVKNFTTTGPATFMKPTVQTSNATAVSSTDATFVGRINPNGSETTYWFEYSTDSLLGSLIGTGTPRGTVTGITTLPVQINVNGLEKNTKYYYHLVATNQEGTVNGAIVSFTTKK